ncbi:hypothetical protein QCE79_33370, partial [Caballeronia sp. LZ003]|nr:hypothetical protein [Caballeronia sp. LZ003]
MNARIRHHQRKVTPRKGLDLPVQDHTACIRHSLNSPTYRTLRAQRIGNLDHLSWKRKRSIQTDT